MIREIRYAIRQLAKHPGFTLVSALTLGLGIGANTAIFSVVNALLLRPLPYPHSERVVLLRERSETFDSGSVRVYRSGVVSARSRQPFSPNRRSQSRTNRRRARDVELFWPSRLTAKT